MDGRCSKAFVAFDWFHAVWLLDAARGEASVTHRLLGISVEEARGIPLHAKELCKWLADNSMLEVDQHGNTGLRKAVKADAFTPPSLHNIVRAHIDQLSPRLGTVLRFASILGYTFDTQVLHGLVKDELGLSMSVLHGQLCTLEDAGFVRQRSDVGGQLLDEKDYRTSWQVSGWLHARPPNVASIAKLLSGEAVPPRMWWWSLMALFCFSQFSQSIYQQVVYSAILHKHRRQLHRNAAEMLMKQLGELEGSTTLHAKQRQRELHSQMAEHWLKVIDGIHKPVGAKRLSDADFSGLFKVISWQVTDSLENCNVQDTLRFQVGVLCVC